MSSAAARGPPAQHPGTSPGPRAPADAKLRTGWLTIVLLVLASHALVLATPGFFSHDEWQKADIVEALGLEGYARQYGALRVGPDFGFPVRPLGFLEQGVAAQFMRSAPWVAHLFNVLNHAACALAFAWLLRRAGAGRRLVALAVLAFIAAPLTTLATGWVAASFDQLYVLFLLLAAGAWLPLGDTRRLGVRLALLALLTACALLSKETAVMALPGALLLAWWTGAWRDAALRRRAAIGVAIVGAVVAAYLVFRAPAIAHSLAGRGASAYTPSPGNVPANALRYFAFPFLVNDTEMSRHVALRSAPMVLAVALHAALVAGLARACRVRAALAYLAAYFLFLVPVLPLPGRGAHYLYASALPFALALAVLADRALAWPARAPAAPPRLPARAAAAGLVVAAATLLAHSIRLQWYVYDTGRCQARFLAGAEALLRHAGTAGPLRIEVEPGAPSYVAKRAIFDRSGFRHAGQARLAFSDEEGTAAPAVQGAAARMTPACRLVPPAAPALAPHAGLP
jgi:hypothetical protein